jgi:hypothetical protein
MSFSATSTKIKLKKDGHTLSAICKTRSGGSVKSKLNLNTCLGNNDGRFTWGGENFSLSAWKVKLHDSDDGLKLKAHLQRVDPNDHIHDSVNLDERITNDDGTLVYHVQ